MPDSTSASSASVTSVEKKPREDVLKPALASSDIDVAAQLTAGKEIVVDPAEAARIRCVRVTDFYCWGSGG